MKTTVSVFHYRKTALAVIAIVSLLFIQRSGLAQDSEDGLTLTLRRNFGYSSGTGQIQGNFTISARGPDNLTQVVFLVDGEEMGVVSESPFELKFDTDHYPLGVHILMARGTTSDGRELQSNEQRREFVPAEEGWRTAGKIAIPIIGVVFLMMLVSFVLPMVMGRGKRSSLPLGTPRSYGMLGGTICPKCGRPFGMHLWGFNLVAGKLDRCPYCGRWSLVHRASMDTLHAAEAAELEGARAEPLSSTASPEETLRKELDDSRFQDL